MNEYSLPQPADPSEIGCINGHGPEHMETRPAGARVCAKCRNIYFAKNIRKSQTRKEYKNNDRSKP